MNGQLEADVYRDLVRRLSGPGITLDEGVVRDYAHSISRGELVD